MEKLTEKEFGEIMGQLDKAGWQPMLCDTPIPVYESVHAGNPCEKGQIPPDMVLVPKAFLSMYPESMVKVIGSSMIDLGIEDGDWVKMMLGRTPRDGDIVVVALGSECTLKSYYEDDDGSRWLVPQNIAEKDKYKVIKLRDDDNSVYLCGVVTELCKPMPRVSSKNMRSLVNEAKAEGEEEPRISEQRVRSVTKMLGPEIKVARQWYAVCRSMMDELIYDDRQYGEFCSMVRHVLPYHQHLPKDAEMQAMAVQSFAKPVYKWDEKKAPVSGKRYKVYKELAERTVKLLTMSEAEFAKL